MKPIVVTEFINAPQEAVFAALTDIPGWADRIEAIDTIEMHTEPPVGVGTRFTETRTIMGKQASETMTVTAFDPPRSWVLEAESHGAHYATTTTLTPDEPGTRIEMSLVASPINTGARVMQTCLGWLMTGQIRKCFAKDLAELKAHCEAAAVETPAS